MKQSTISLGLHQKSYSVIAEELSYSGWLIYFLSQLTMKIYSELTIISQKQDKNSTTE